MISVSGKYGKKSSKFLASLVTILVIGLLLWAGPASAFSVALTGFSVSNPLVGEIISTNATVSITSLERYSNIPINLTLTGGAFSSETVYCAFNAIDGSSIGGDCSGVDITLVSNNAQEGYGYGYQGYGYGYGYSNGTFNYNIDVNTSDEDFVPGQTYRMRIVSSSGASDYSEFSIGATVSGELFEGVGFLLPAGATQENTSNVTVNNDWTVNLSDGSQVLIPEGTVISGYNGSNINLSAITSQLVSLSNLSGLSGLKGALEFGIPGFSLSFSSPITIRIFVGNDSDGKTFNVYRSTDGSTWEQAGLNNVTCTVASGICEFQTQRASYFGSTESSSGSAGGSGSCYTDWECTEWSACVDGLRVRSCTIPVTSCKVPTKPLEAQLCGERKNVEETTEASALNEEEKGFNSLLTGAVIGTLKSPVFWSVAVFILLILIGLVVASKRKKVSSVKKKGKKN